MSKIYEQVVLCTIEHTSIERNEGKEKIIHYSTLNEKVGHYGTNGTNGINIDYRSDDRAPFIWGKKYRVIIMEED